MPTQGKRRQDTPGSHCQDGAQGWRGQPSPANAPFLPSLSQAKPTSPAPFWKAESSTWPLHSILLPSSSRARVPAAPQEEPLTQGGRAHYRPGPQGAGLKMLRVPAPCRSGTQSGSCLATACGVRLRGRWAPGIPRGLEPAP